MKSLLVFISLLVFGLNMNQIKAQLSAGFITQDTLCELSLIQFTDTSLGNPTSWLWTFGDPGSGLNDSSFLQNPTHKYAASNAYNVTLVVCNGLSCDTTNQTVIVDSKPTPLITGPQYVQLQGSAVYNTVFDFGHSYLWTVIGGQIWAGQGTNSISVDWISTGAGSVCVTESDFISGCDSTYCFPVNVLNQSPAISYGYMPSVPCANMPVSYSAYTTFPASGWFWDFGDGSTSGQQNPSHAYSAPGLYNVTVLYNNSTLSDTSYFTIYIDSTCAGQDFVSGQVYHDLNSNGLKDSGERGLPGVLVEVNPGNFLLSTNGNGAYGFYQGTGSWSIGIINPANGTLTQPALPGTYPVTTTNSSSSFTGYDFGVSMPFIQDLELTTSGVPPRPGVSRLYYIHFKNAGTINMSGSIEFVYDTLLTYVSASPGATVSGDTVIWNFNNLLPGASGYKLIELYADTSTVFLGDTFCYTASINPTSGDATPQNNVSNVCLTVISSYDPNDKQTQTGNGPIDSTQNLVYRVRFQNTGSAPANTVTVRDTIDNNLDLGSFNFLGASHGHNWNIHGNVLTVNFPNIELPDSGTNEPASHGWLMYSLKPKPGLAPNTHLLNRAGIFFDFNPVVMTNTTDNWIDLPVIITSSASGMDYFKLYPNPVHDRFTVSYMNATGDMHTFRIINVHGKVLFTSASTSGEFLINRNGLPPGIYLWELLEHNGKKHSGKLIME